MNLRENFLTGKLRSFLDRRSMPRGLADKPQAIRDELGSLVRCMVRFAPNHDYEDWWVRFEDRLAEDGQTRAWPTEGEIKKAAMSLRGTISRKPAQGDEIDPITIIAKRMNAGEAVGDSCFYGRVAVDLLRSGNVDMATMRKYRSGFYFSAKNVYGEKQARAMEAELISRHEAAEKMDTVQRKPRNIPAPSPKKIPTYEWDGAS